MLRVFGVKFWLGVADNRNMEKESIIEKIEKASKRYFYITLGIDGTAETFSFKIPFETIKLQDGLFVLDPPEDQKTRLPQDPNQIHNLIVLSVSVDYDDAQR